MQHGGRFGFVQSLIGTPAAPETACQNIVAETRYFRNIEGPVEHKNLALQDLGRSNFPELGIDIHFFRTPVETGQSLGTDKHGSLNLLGDDLLGTAGER